MACLAATATRLLPAAAFVAVLLVAGPAAAHVEVAADNAVAGARDVTLSFHVPNEEAPATTVAVRIVLPTEHPLIGVTAQRQHGFDATVRTRPLATPVTGPDGPVRTVATEVDFRHGRIAGAAEPAFTVHVQQLPSDVGSLTFKALQTYSTGAVVRWIEVAADGGPEPEHPAPVLTLRSSGTGGQPASPTPSTHVEAISRARSASIGDGWLVAIALGAAAAVGLLLIPYARRVRR